MPRAWVPDWTEYGISRERYRELLAFCRQYPEWKSEAASLIGIGAQNYEERISGGDVPSQVVRQAERRELLVDNITLVERVARLVDDGRWFTAIIQNVCMAKPLSCLDPAILPTSRRNDYFHARRAFFVALDADKQRRTKLDTRGDVIP